MKEFIREDSIQIKDVFFDKPLLIARKAQILDINFIIECEKESFPRHRQSSKRSISNSIKSLNQEVYIVEVDSGGGIAQAAGVCVLFKYKRSVRLYSLAVLPKFRRMGVGNLLMQTIINSCVILGHEKISLEADAANEKLIMWYRKFGFETSQILQDYYQEAEPAVRMIRRNEELDERLILVTDDDYNMSSIAGSHVFSAKDYLSNSDFCSSNSYHVINLCKTYKTHSIGYYVSLLASARNHRVIPSVMTFKDCTEAVIAQSILDEIQGYLSNKLKNISERKIELTILLGKAVPVKFSDIGKKMFSLFNLPLFNLEIEKRDKWIFKKIRTLSLEEVMSDYPDILMESICKYQSRRYYRRHKLRKYKYDLAILVNPHENNPPSCSVALKKFVKAAEKIGFFVEFITKSDKRRICEFDALFIRETTVLDNHTYAIARHAYTEGLVVIDDPWSILLCSNKIYLHERLANTGILQPKGWLLTKKTFKSNLVKEFSYPLVLKLPESSFSLGVFRVNNQSEMTIKIKQLFSKSDLVLVQEFLLSDYDWRIGILDNQPLFACKYYMANKHWQIYNWQAKAVEDSYGQHDTIPINQVPPSVIKTAIKVASLIGNGLYGIDIKEVGQKSYVIEINDNPNIDYGVEDAVLGDELYERIMCSIFNRIEIERNQTRYLM